MKAGGWLIGGLALALAFVLGVLSGEHWIGIDRIRNWEREREFARRLWSDSARRSHDTAEARRHAEALLRMQRHSAARPREVRRVQLYEHCAVSFVIQDSLRQNNVLLSARASSPRPGPTVPMGEAWTYKAGGFAAGDTATVVFPHVMCNQLFVPGLFSNMVPDRDLRLHVVP